MSDAELELVAGASRVRDGEGAKNRSRIADVGPGLTSIGDGPGLEMEAWRTVWGRRGLDARRGSVLAQLMAADGFDTGFGDLSEAAWRCYVDSIARQMGIERGHSVFDVGCGAGAFLYPLVERAADVAGLDYSTAQIAMARETISPGGFTLAHAAKLDLLERCDFVVASGVFCYFPTLGYAREVLARMMTKARCAVAFLDIPDAAKREAALHMRRAHLTPAEYEARYRGLDHLYFERAWFRRELEVLGAARIEIRDQNIAGYANSAHRFNVVAWR